MKRILVGLGLIIVLPGCIVTTRPVQSPRVFVEEPAPVIHYYYSPYRPPYQYNYHHHYHNHPPRGPQHYGPRRK